MIICLVVVVFLHGLFGYGLFGGLCLGYSVVWFGLFAYLVIGYLAICFFGYLLFALFVHCLQSPLPPPRRLQRKFGEQFQKNASNLHFEMRFAFLVIFFVFHLTL